MTSTDDDFSKIMYQSLLLLKDELQTFGVDGEAGLPEQNDDAVDQNGVIVPEILNPLNETDFAFLLERISALERSSPWDIEPYLCALQTVEELSLARNNSE